jgi:hypothetical protein
MQRQQIPGLFRMWRSRESRRKPKGVWLRSAAKPSREAAAPQSTFSATVSAHGQLGRAGTSVSTEPAGITDHCHRRHAA